MIQVPISRQRCLTLFIQYIKKHGRLPLNRPESPQTRSVGLRHVEGLGLPQAVEV